MEKRWVILIAFVVLAAGCKDGSTSPLTTDQNVLIRMTATPGKSAGSIVLGKVSGTGSVLATVDSLFIDSAMVVLKDITFKSVVDTVQTRDSSNCDKDDDAEDHGGEGSARRVHFKGPFLVRLYNGQPVLIALDTIPAGSYDGIKFEIHKLRMQDVLKHPSFPDSLVGYSIVIFGRVKYAGAPSVPFVFKTDINEEFKVKGNFVVAPGVKIVPYVLNFDLTSWFNAGFGRILDPNSLSDRRLIRQAIKAALKGWVHGGRDFNEDGDPD
jgi:hypothetical protein